MRYLHKYRSETSAIATDQTVISSNYLERPEFDFSIPLHAGLHYVFLAGVGLVTNAKGYELRMAINKFLDFTAEYNSKVVPALQITVLNDVGAEEYKRFEEFLRLNNSRLYLAIRLKSAIKHVARRFDDGMPVLKLPVIEEPPSAPTEPLSDQADDDFYEVMYKEVDLIREKLSFQAALEHAQPYDKWEVRELSRDLMSLRKTGRSDWVIDPLRAAATLEYHGFPFHFPPAWIECMQVDSRVDTLSFMGRKPLEFVLSCCMHKGFLRFRAPGCISFKDLFQLMYPTAQDQVTLALFIQRQLGWNKESVLALDKDRYLHPLSEFAKQDSVLIVSSKIRSQGQGLAYIKPKLAVATSKRSDPYSAYNLIRLACDLSARCRKFFQLDPRIKVDDKRHQTPFLLFQDPRMPWGVHERISSLDAQGFWNEGMKGFLAKAQLMDNGVPLLGGESLQGRLRVTSLQKSKAKHRHPLALTALLYGHADRVTTDTHYDSSVSAMLSRRKRFHAFQEGFIKKTQQGQFRGFMGKPASQQSKHPKFRILTLIGHERPLWACLDCTQPSFPGSQPLASGARCTRLDKCNGCAQWCVLEDSLPFLMDRHATLGMQIERDPGSYNNYASELQILQYLIDKLKNKSALDSATAYRNKYEVLLPLDLKSLIAYIED